MDQVTAADAARARYQRRLAVLFEDAADHDPDLGTGGFPNGPVDGDVLPDRGHQFGGDHLEFVNAHDLDGALVHRQGIVYLYPRGLWYQEWEVSYGYR